MRAPKQLWPANLRALRKRCELRVEDVAWICGVTPRAVNKWMRGENRIPQWASLLLQAYEAGLLTARWIADRVDAPPPR